MEDNTVTISLEHYVVMNRLVEEYHKLLNVIYEDSTLNYSKERLRIQDDRLVVLLQIFDPERYQYKLEQLQQLDEE